MKKFIMIFLLMLIPQIVFAGSYFSVKGGASKQTDYNLHYVKFTHNPSYAFSASIGWDFGKWRDVLGLRTEFEYLNMNSQNDRIVSLDETNSVDNPASENFNSFFLNGFLDIPLCKKVELFVGGGYGFPKYQLIGGLSYKINNKWGITTEYRRVEKPYEARSYNPNTGEVGYIPPCCGISSTIQTGGHAEDDGRSFDIFLIGLKYQF